jgi:ribonucleoside-diphosphate reductase alpha chain
MIDNVIELMDYPFPSLKTTAQARRSLGVGITNLAHHMAYNGMSYSTKEGKTFIHNYAEKHSYWLHKASLRLAKERGVCSWMNKTKYPDGWLPIDTYNKNADSACDGTLLCDWETLRKEIVENGGIRNSVLEAIMPVESSSQLTNTTNSIYPIRNLKVVKTSGNNKNLFIAPDAEVLAKYYDIAWEVDSKDLIDCYAIVQKFVGQAISCDLYLSFSENTRKVSVKRLIEDFLYMTKMGLKTRYYINSSSGVSYKKQKEEIEEKGCACGGCTL